MIDLPVEKEAATDGKDGGEVEESLGVRHGGWFREDGSGQWVALDSKSDTEEVEVEGEESEGELEMEDEESEEDVEVRSDNEDSEAEGIAEVDDKEESDGGGNVSARELGLEEELEMEQQLPKEALERLRQKRREKAALVGTTRVSTYLHRFQ